MMRKVLQPGMVMSTARTHLWTLSCLTGLVKCLSEGWTMIAVPLVLSSGKLV